MNFDTNFHTPWQISYKGWHFQLKYHGKFTYPFAMAILFIIVVLIYILGNFLIQKHGIFNWNTMSNFSTNLPWKLEAYVAMFLKNLIPCFLLTRSFVGVFAMAT